MNRTTSLVGINLIKKWEGLVLEPYYDAAGIRTIGYGHLCVDITGAISEQTAEQFLQTDIGTAECAVDKYIELYQWSQSEYDALVSFTFNLGAGNLNKLVNNGKRTRSEIAAAWPQYCHAGGRVILGLVNRRAEELALFLSERGGTADAETNALPDVPYLLHVTVSDLIIRDAPNGSPVTEDRSKRYTGKGIFTIVEVSSDQQWGRLKSGAGWISLNPLYSELYK